MIKKFKIGCFLFWMLFTIPVCAQNTSLRTIKGRVINVADGTPLSGVLVSTAEITGYSTLTEENGTYILQVPQYASSILITAPDFQMVKTGIARDGQISEVSLYPAKLKADYRSTTDILSQQQIEGVGYSPAITIKEEIQKNLGASVHTTVRSGAPGIGSVMFMGGLNSLNANAQPLVVIDGVIIDQQYGRQMLHSGFYNDILSAVSPADIERVTVLRNGTALYGAKGANGVILVDTRSNHSMATRITATLSGGVSLEPKYVDMMSANQYRGYASELLKSTGTKASDFKFLNENPSYYYYGQYHNQTDWKKQVYRTAITQNYGINVEGGDEVANYNLSLGYVNAQSVANYNSMDRLNVRLNTDINFSERFTARFNASFTNQSRNLRDDGAPESYEDGTPTSPTFLAYVKSPFLSPYTYSGGKVSESHLDVNDESYLDEALRNYPYYKLANPYSLNVYGEAENKNHFENSMLNVAVAPRFQITPNWSVQEHFSYNLISTNEKYYIPLYGVPDYYVSSVASTRENEVRSLFAKQNSIMSDTRVDWHRRYEAHEATFFGGARVIRESYTLNSQYGYNTGNDKTPFIHSGLADAGTAGYNDAWTNIAWYAQGTYNYLQRYYFQLNLTAETSSRFGLDAKEGIKLFEARWGLFPAVQAGWVVSNEKWLANVKGIDYLKVSAGYDVSGNDDIDNHAAQSYFASRKYLDKILGLTLSGIGNKQIQWERTSRLNMSVEANFMNNRLHMQANMFRSQTDHLLTLQSLSYLTGVDNNWGNSGSLTNRGFDVSANTRIVVTRDWQWELGASVGHYKNELISLPGNKSYMDTPLCGATVRSAVGEPVNLFYGYKTQGVFATSEEAAAENLSIKADNGIDRTYFQAGDVHFADLHSDGCIDESDRTVIGNPNPDLFGNIFTNIGYKRLRLEVQFNYSLGNDVYNYMRQQLESGSRFMNQTLALTRRWHGEGHQTDVPKITFLDPMGNARFSDRWIEDGSYLKLKSATLSYQLPVKSQFLQGLEFWLQANNVFTFTRYLGGDPESAMTSSVIGQGIDRGMLPQSRSVVAGVKINL